MLTHVSNPLLRQWLRMFSIRRSHKNSVTDPWGATVSVSGLFSQSTWSLGVVALWFKKVNRQSGAQILLPDFFCDSALVVVRALGFMPVFYPIDENGFADLTKMRELCSVNRPTLLVMVHYFGSTNSQSSVIKEIAEVHGAWLVEDCAHCIVPNGNIGTTGDFVMFSPHKLLPIPFGAVLNVRKDGPAGLGDITIRQFGDPETWAIQVREAVKFTRLRVRSARGLELIWVLKRSVQRVGLARKSRQNFNILANNGSSEATLADPALPKFSKHLLNVLLAKPKQNVPNKFLLPPIPSVSALNHISTVRQHNVSIWDEVIEALSGGELKALQFDVTVNVPYLASYFGDANTIHDTITKLHNLGVPVSTWPDLPKEVLSKKNVHVGAMFLKSTRLYLPVHHNISALDIQRLLGRIRVRQQQSCETVTRRSELSPVMWRGYLSRVEYSNLLQAWEYGEAKAKSEDWSVQRWVYSIDGIDVAISQVLERRVLGIKISRLSRGPLLLTSANVNQINLVLKVIIDKFSWVKLRILSVSPEIYLGSEERITEGISRLRRISTVGANSSLLNLDQDLSDLRNKLNSKWRNQLRFSERSGVRVVSSTNNSDFLWFETIYDLMKREKEFSGIPTSLFGNIWREFLLTNSAHLLIGEYEGSNIAAVLLVTHGKSATYLAGWNGSIGRKLNANNLLLWEAASQLKSWGFSRFDLGGIDKLHTPTISRFKAGMGGEDYRSIGEFIKV